MGQHLNLERFHQVILFGAIFPRIMRNYFMIILEQMSHLPC